MSLRQKAIEGSKSTISGELALTLTRFGTIPIFARFITPEGYGLIAIALSLTAFLNVLMEGGLSSATLQRPTLTETERSSLHWVNASIGLLGLVILCAAGPLVNHLYGHSEFTLILPCYGLISLLRSLNVQRVTLMQRELLFSKLVKINLISQLSGTAVGIAMAIYGLGFWSLIAIDAVAILLTNTLLRFAHAWRPRFEYDHSVAKPLIKFGAPIMFSNLLGNATKGLDVLLLGLFHSTAQVGLFSRANRLVRLPLQQALGPISSVLRPVIFAKANSDTEGFERNVYLITRLISLFGATVAVLSIAFAEQAVRILLGEQWLEAIPISIALAPFIFSVPTVNMLSQVIIAKGDSMPVLNWRIFSTVIMLVTVSISVHWGAIGLAIGISLSGILVRVPLFIIYTARKVDLRASSLFRCMLPGTLAMFAGFFLAASLYLLGHTRALVDALWSGASVLAVFSSIYLLFPSGRETVKEAYNLTKLRKKPKVKKPASDPTELVARK